MNGRELKNDISRFLNGLRNRRWKRRFRRLIGNVAEEQEWRVTRIKAYMTTIKHTLQRLRTCSANDIESAENFQQESVVIRANINSLLERIPLDNFRNIAGELESSLKKLFEKVERGYILESPLTDDLKIVLRQYLQNGQKILDSGSFENSTLDFLDQMALDLSAFFNVHNNPAGITIPTCDLVFDTAFIALAAPSLEGKTQSAFVLRKTKVLYFVVFSQKRIESSAQPIYSCFTSPSLFLKKIAQDDLLVIRNFQGAAIPDLSATELGDAGLKDTPLRVLGYFAKLMELAGDVDASSWLETFANLDGFSFSPLSPAQFRSRIRSLCKTTIFLDEFVSEEWAVYVRNLVRAMNLPCIVSNTNTEIANLISRPTSFSRTSGCNTCWCVVIRRLNPTASFLVDEAQEVLNFFKRRCTGMELKRNFEAFDHFFDNVLALSRPGIIAFLADILNDWRRQVTSGNTTFEPISLAKFLQRCASRLGSRLVLRKKAIKSFESSMIAKIGLLLPSSYTPTGWINEDREDVYACFRSHRHIHNHLFYLNNPVNKDKCLFLTFKMTDPTEEHVQIFPRGGTYSHDWALHLTSFNASEFFTFLACLNVPFHYSVGYIMTTAFSRFVTAGVGATDARSFSALSLPGNHYEAVVAACIADSSQHAHEITDPFVADLSGQDGESFLRNLIANRISRELLPRSEINLHIHPSCSRFMYWFKLARIPFLYSIGPEVEVGTKRPLFDAFSRLYGLDDAFVSRYIRTGNELQIDGSFQFDNNRNICRAVVECKNVLEPVNVTSIFDIMDRITKATPKPRLAFIFCSSLSETKNKNTKLAALAREECFNVYYLTSLGVPGTFALKPYSEGPIPVFDAPTMEVIILPTENMS